MIESVRIDGFRGLDGVELDALGQFNLLVGPGNAGKTSLIEALFLFLSNGDATLLPRTFAARRIDTKDQLPRETVEYIDWFFTVRGSDQSFRIQGTVGGKERSVLIRKLNGDTQIPLRSAESDTVDEDAREALAIYEIETRTDGSVYGGRFYVGRGGGKVTVPRAANIPGRLVSPLEQGQSKPLAAVWSEVDDRGYHQRIVRMLQELDADIEDVRLGADTLSHAFVRLDHARLGRMPLEFLGGGLGKAIAIACHTIAARDGLLLVDEFDASLHPGAQPIVIEFLMRAAQENNVQVCASTHSIETVDAFLEAHDELGGLFKGPEGLRVFQLRNVKGRTEVKSLDAETARRLRADVGHDLRLRA